MTSPDVFTAAMESYARAMGERRFEDALGYIRAAETAAKGRLPAWVPEARAELETRLGAAPRPRLGLLDVPRVHAIAARVVGDGQRSRRTLVRRLVHYVFRRHSTVSLPELAAATGCHSHATVLEGVRAIEEWLADPAPTRRIQWGGGYEEIENPREALAQIEAELGLARADAALAPG